MHAVTPTARPSRKYESLLLGIVVGAVFFSVVRAVWAEVAGPQPGVHPMMGFYFVPVISLAVFAVAAVCEAVIARLIPQAARPWTHNALIGLSWSTPLGLIVGPIFGAVALFVVNPVTVRYFLRKSVGKTEPSL